MNKRRMASDSEEPNYEHWTEDELKGYVPINHPLILGIYERNSIPIVDLRPADLERRARILKEQVLKNVWHEIQSRVEECIDKRGRPAALHLLEEEVLILMGEVIPGENPPEKEEEK